MHRVRIVEGKEEEKKVPGSIEHGWDKSGNKSLIVRRIFIRTLEMIYCAKIGDLR